MNVIPCQHLVATVEPRCYLGRGYPHECSGCSAYQAGMTYEEVARYNAWEPVIGIIRGMPSGSGAPRRDRRPAERASHMEDDHA